MKLLLFLDFCGFTRKPAQIIKFCAAHFAGAHDVDVRDLRGMQGEATLHAYAEGKTANGKCLADPAVLFGDNYAFKVLDTLFSAFDDTIADLDSVAHIELRNVFLHVLGFDLLDESHDDLPPCIRDVHFRFAAEERPKSRAIIIEDNKKINLFYAVFLFYNMHFEKITGLAIARRQFFLLPVSASQYKRPVLRHKYPAEGACGSRCVRLHHKRSDIFHS